MSRRTDRIGEQIRAEVDRVLREEVSDPRIGMRTVTRVDVAPDLSNARIHGSTFEGPNAADPAEMSKGLASAAPYVRRQLARVLPTRRVPELRFEHDPSLSAGAKTLSLLAELEQDAKEQD